MTSTALILPEEIDDFARIPEAARREALFWMRLMARVERDAANKGIGAALAGVAAQYAGRRRFSPSTLRRKWDAWRGSRDFKSLLDRVKFPSLFAETPAALPGAFIEKVWKPLVLARQRGKVAAAHRELLRQWRRWRAGDPLAAMEGYDVCPPPAPGKDHPEGWSYRNLSREEFLPTPMQVDAARFGLTAAKEHGLQIFTTRAGMYVGQYYLFDDIEHDNKVNAPGQKVATRPLELHALDLFSGNKFEWGLIPTRYNEDTEKKEKLKGKEMLWLLAAVLIRHGYSPRGTTLIVEHATAAISDDMEALIHGLTGEKVTVQRSGMTGAAAFAGQYSGRGKGNFKFKAALESLGNLIHNELDALPGQVGLNRDNAPAELAGWEKYNDALLAAMAQLPEEVRQLLAWPGLTFDEFKRIAAQVYFNIATTPRHQLEGWEEAGLTVHEWRLDPMHDFAALDTLRALPAERRQIAEALIEQDPRLRNRRRLARAEVWARGRNELARLPISAMPVILGRDNAEEMHVEGNRITFENFEYGPGEHRYIAHARDGMGGETLLRNGQTYLVYATPFWPEYIFCCDGKGRFIGACAKDHTPCRSDEKAIARTMGLGRKMEAEQLAPLATYRAELGHRRTAMHKHNAAILGHVNRVRQGKASRMTAVTAKRFSTDAEALAVAPASKPAAKESFDGNDLL